MGSEAVKLGSIMDGNIFECILSKWRSKANSGTIRDLNTTHVCRRYEQMMAVVGPTSRIS